jgi:hypothetical protein
MPRTYRAKQSGAFGTNAYPDTSPEIDVAGAIGAITQAIATTREALIMREQMRAAAKRQSMMDAFMMDRAKKEDARADAQEKREGARDVREQGREDRDAAADLEDRRFKGAERASKGYVPGGVRAVPRVSTGVSPMGSVPSIDLVYQAPHIDPSRSAEQQTKAAERKRKRDAYGRSGKIPEGVLDAAVEDDAIARSYLGNPLARANRNRDEDQEEEEDITRAFTAVNTQVDDARARVSTAKTKFERPEDIAKGPPRRAAAHVLKQFPGANESFPQDSAAYATRSARFEADSSAAAGVHRRETARLDSLMSVQEALAARMQGKEPPKKADFSRVQGGSSSAATPRPAPKPDSSRTPNRVQMLEKAKRAFEASIAKPGADTAALRTRYQRVVQGINAKYPR